MLRHLFIGIKVAVLVVVIEAVIKIGQRAITSVQMLALAIASLRLYFLFLNTVPHIIVCAGVLGLFFGKLKAAQNGENNAPAVNKNPATVIDMMEFRLASCYIPTLLFLDLLRFS